MAKKQDEVKKPAASKVFVGLQGEPGSFVESTRGQTQFVSGVDKTSIEQEVLVSPALLINKLDHPMTISYEGLAMIVPPRGRVKVANMQKVGGYPKGMQLVPLKA
jgi:hypothetical protein